MEPAARSAPVRWSWAQRAGFRFAFCYFALFFLNHYPLELIPGYTRLIQPYNWVWHQIVLAVNGHLLHLPYDLTAAWVQQDFGVGNTPLGTILFVCYLATAALVTLVWSLLDRERPHYQRLHQWFRLVLRCGLGITMIHYGVIKLIPNQMVAPPPLGLLTGRIADLSRMRMLWISVGSAPEYESFTGLAEVLGGVLLLVPRTVLLGALLCTVNMSLVFVLNMAYDVQVKLYSFNLLVMAVLLVLPDLQRLANVIVLQRPTQPAPAVPLFAAGKWKNRLPHLAVALIGFATLVTGLSGSWDRYQRMHPPKPPLYGLWKVEKFVAAGQEVPRGTDPKRWLYVFLQRPGVMTIESMIGSYQGYGVNVDLAQGKLLLGKFQRGADGQPILDAEGKPQRDPGWQAELRLSKNEPEEIWLDGDLDGQPLHVELQKAMLLRDGFHWFFEPPEEDR